MTLTHTRAADRDLAGQTDYYGLLRTFTDGYGQMRVPLARTRAADRRTSESRTSRTHRRADGAMAWQAIRTIRTPGRVTRLRQGYGAASHNQRLFADRDNRMSYSSYSSYLSYPAPSPRSAARTRVSGDTPPSRNSVSANTRLRERSNGLERFAARIRLLRAGRPRARSPHGSDFVPQAGDRAAFMPRRL